MTKRNNNEASKQRRCGSTPQGANKLQVEELGVYINLLTDFGFKRIFGIKEVMIHFLNTVLDIKGGITDISYGNPERHGLTADERKAIYDLYCTTGNGEHIIVEMQAIRQQYFKDRVLLYATRLFQEQSIKGKVKGKDWDCNLHPVFSINILDFYLDQDVETEKYTSYVQLMDRDAKTVFYDKLTFVYIELPRFTKELSQLKSFFEQWIFIIRHLHELNEAPEALSNEIFETVFQQAAIARMTKQQVTKYIKELNNMNIVKNELAYRDNIIVEQGNALVAERNAHAITNTKLEAALAELNELKKAHGLNGKN